MKKLLTLTVALCLVICAVFVLNACGENINIAGKTYAYERVEVVDQVTEEQQTTIESAVSSQNLDKVRVSFNEDNTYEVNVTVSGFAGNPVQTGTWRIEGNNVVLTPDDEETAQTYIYSNGKFYGNISIPYGEGENEIANSRLWFVEVQE